MVGRIIPILGDQLSEGLSALTAADPARDLVVMAEVAEETGYVPHHPKKIAFVLTAMRKFADRLRAQGWRVAYTRLDNPANTGSITGEILRHAGPDHDRVLITRPGEWRLIAAMEVLPLPVEILEDSRFLSTPTEFAAWASGRKQLRMEYFYREMRRKTGLLMEGDAPAGGRWNFDTDNRKRAEPDLLRARPRRFTPDPVTNAVLDMVGARVADHFGALTPFWFATDRAQARAALDHFIEHSLPDFGATQDAMLTGDPFLNHSVLSIYLNTGLLTPLEVCKRAEAAWRSGRAPLNSVEGFIRQIIGWREFVRGVYFLQGPDYVAQNHLGHTRPLPDAYWGGPTRMACLKAAVDQTRTEAYAHHIQRLMITGNFAALAGLNPQQVHEWYLAVYADAYEWIEAPNTLGMSQFADGGLFASKPYVSSGAYINRMSDYCRGCAYDVRVRTGPDACPFNPLYWAFLDRHRKRFAANPRMRPIYSNWNRTAPERRRAILDTAARLLDDLDRGKAP
jgi:deoxyribodipyrimidine photolyase-related protein